MADTTYDTEWLDGYCGNVTEGADGTIASCMIYNVSFGVRGCNHGEIVHLEQFMCCSFLFLFLLVLSISGIYQSCGWFERLFPYFRCKYLPHPCFSSFGFVGFCPCLLSSEVAGNGCLHAIRKNRSCQLHSCQVYFMALQFFVRLCMFAVGSCSTFNCRSFSWLGLCSFPAVVDDAPMLFDWIICRHGKILLTQDVSFLFL